MAQSVDEILDRRLAGPAQEKYAEREMRQKKQGAADNEAEQPRTLREKVMAVRRAMDLKQKAKDKLKEKVTDPMKMGTNTALKWAWTVLVPSFGLSLIYINTHVFLRWIFPSAFCKLGEEWIPKQITGEHSSKNVAGTAFGIVEVMGLLFLDLVALFILLSVIAFFSLIVGFMGAGLWDKIKWVWDIIGSLGLGSLDVIKALFS